MCFPDDGRPPALPGPQVEAGLARTVLRPRSGPAFAVSRAVPVAATSRTAVLVIPDGRGLAPYYAQLALGFARTGREALAVDLYGRTAGVGPRGADFSSGEHSARLTWAGVRQDLSAAIGCLRRDEPARPVIAVGFCLGGRVSLLAAAAADLELSGAVALYSQTSGPARSDLPAPDRLVDELCCPVLTMFGGADELIPAVEVERWRDALAAAGRDDDVVVYADAPHSFFDRAASRYAAESADAAARMLAFMTSIESVPA
ncbi:MAG: dienelactone hydrolase family protein [Jatrophihabitantaceae bacterium]